MPTPALRASVARLWDWMSRSSPGRGLALMVVATMSGSVMAAVVRHLIVDFHPFEAAFFRTTFGLIMLSPLFIRRGFAPFRTQRLRHHAMRAILNVATMLCFMTSLGFASLSKVTALGFASPLFATLLAALFLGEALRFGRIIALAIGFLGMLVIVRPGLIEFDVGTLVILTYAMAWGVAMTAIKSLARTESSLTVTLYMYTLSLPILIVGMIPFWKTPTPTEFAWFLLLGVLGNMTALSFAQALRDAEITAVLPLDFTRLLWASILGFVFFAETPEIWIWVGGAMIFASSTYISIQEGRRILPPPAAEERKA